MAHCTLSLSLSLICMWSNCECTELKTTVTMLSNSSFGGHAFLHISLTICVTTAQCERSFSSLKRIKTYLRSTMSEQRLVDLAILSIEHKISKSLSLDEVVDNFASQDKNRRILLTSHVYLSSIFFTVFSYCICTCLLFQVSTCYIFVTLINYSYTY